MDTTEYMKKDQRLLDLVRAGSIVLLLLHIYFYGYSAFAGWGFRSEITDRLIGGFVKTGLFSSCWISKSMALLFLLPSIRADKGRPTIGFGFRRPVLLIFVGLLCYYGSGLALYVAMDAKAAVVSYGLVLLLGYCLFMIGGVLLSRVIKFRQNRDIFNVDNEQFPQENRLIKNRFSIHFPTVFIFNGQKQKGWINIINPFRGTLVLGVPGSGKSLFIINLFIRQHIEKGFVMCLFDFKSPELSLLAYNTWLKSRHVYPHGTRFYNIEFGRPEYSYRCNPLAPAYLTDIIDAAESARSILFNLHPEWAEKTDFWAQSSISFLTALIWYLRKHQGGRYCTLPHVLELLQVDYPRLFSILRAEPDIHSYIGAFLAAFVSESSETLDNQLGSLKIALARLSSPVIYYVMSGNELDLHINDPRAPKLVCLGNTPQRSAIYGAALSLYITTIHRLANRPGMHPCALVYDELPTIRIQQLHELLATGRSNRLAVTICCQDISQLRFAYGRTQADVIVNLPGNLIAGQVSGDSARIVSERIGKIVQEKVSIQVNRTDTSVSQSTALDLAVPPAKISQLKAGEFVGLVADDPRQPLDLKTFHASFIVNFKKVERERRTFRDLPRVRVLHDGELDANARAIREDVERLVQAELARMAKVPVLADLIIIK